MGFWLIPKLVTFNNLDGVTAIILRYLAEFGSFQADYLKVADL